MKKYYPLISVGIAIGMLLLPIAILARPTTNKPAPASTPPTHLGRMEKLEQQVAALKREVERLASRPPQANATATTGNANSDRPAARLAANANVPSTVSKPGLQSPAAPDQANEIRKLQDRLQQLTLEAAQRTPDVGGPAKASLPVQPTVAPVMSPEVNAQPIAKTTVATTAVEPKVSSTPAAEAKPNAVASKATSTTRPAAEPSANPKVASKRPKRTTSKTRRAAMAKGDGGGRTKASDLGGAKGEPSELTDAITVLRTGREPVVADKATYFEMGLVQPRGNYVRQTEELIAVTKEPGWPVVVVRSEIDGDFWWVQQLVTRRGNYIASRTKFGNEVTLRGQRFELVILMLDTVEESVRFKTARRFDKLPNGVRRSKPLQFIRN